MSAINWRGRSCEAAHSPWDHVPCMWTSVKTREISGNDWMCVEEVENVRAVRAHDGCGGNCCTLRQRRHGQEAVLVHAAHCCTFRREKSQFPKSSRWTVTKVQRTRKTKHCHSYAWLTTEKTIANYLIATTTSSQTASSEQIDSTNGYFWSMQL